MIACRYPLPPSFIAQAMWEEGKVVWELLFGIQFTVNRFKQVVIQIDNLIFTRKEWEREREQLWLPSKSLVICAYNCWVNTVQVCSLCRGWAGRSCAPDHELVTPCPTISQQWIFTACVPKRTQWYPCSRTFIKIHPYGSIAIFNHTSATNWKE